MERFDGRCHLDWWANSTTLLASIPRLQQLHRKPLLVTPGKTQRRLAVMHGRVRISAPGQQKCSHIDVTWRPGLQRAIASPSTACSRSVIPGKSGSSMSAPSSRS